MRKRLMWCSAIVLGICLVVSCSQGVDKPSENQREGLVKLETLQAEFKDELQGALLSMSDESLPLLSSVVFGDEEYSKDIVKDGLFTSANAYYDDDAVFEKLDDKEKLKIQHIAENYIDKIESLAKSIIVFDKGLPEGVEETELFVKYAGVEYSKCVRETLEMAYQIRDELYNPNKELTKGAKLWITPRWHLIGAPLGAIFYSYKNDFTKEEKAAIRHAMNEWEDATDATVKFYEKPLNWWGKIKWVLGITHNMRIEKVAKKDYSGLTMPGNMPWSFMCLNIDAVFQNDSFDDFGNWKSKNSWTHSVLIHELGHCIGLQHEFERSDRDAYIEVVDTDDRIPGPCGFARWWQKLFMKNYGSYDFKSCMNYGYFGRGDYKIRGTNREIKFSDINEVSHNDALTVKHIYSRISYKDMINNWQDTRSILLKEEF